MRPIRILFVSNYYPPHGLGGYEQWCQEVAEGLVARGHQVRVLTARRAGERGGCGTSNGVELARRLHLEVEGGLVRTVVRLVLARRRVERADLHHVRSAIRGFRPEAAVIWGMWNISRSVPALVEQLLPHRLAYYFCDYWPLLPSAYVQRWETPARRVATAAPKAALARVFLARLRAEPSPRLRFEQPICVSRAVRHILADSGVPVERARIIYGGTQADNPAPGHAADRPARLEPDVRLLYAGRLTPTKGVHTIIRAMGQLVNDGSREPTLTIIGHGDPDYRRELLRLARACGVSDRVILQDGISRANMPAVLASHDLLVFPSEWEEPFARVVLEAMAAGLAVVGTTTGGTGEVLVDEETGLTFPPGDAVALARQLRRLLEDAPLRQRLAHAAGRRVRREFSLTRMVDQFESTLLGMAGHGLASAV
jgi:glycosyltransferase involved in cell wall biosynthesis